jgi:hypothetical protein
MMGIERGLESEESEVKWDFTVRLLSFCLREERVSASCRSFFAFFLRFSSGVVFFFSRVAGGMDGDLEPCVRVGIE